MVTLYWAGQYAAVFLGYYLLMFLWPSVVFRRYLCGKGKLYHFSFCITVQIVLINTAILGMGLLGVLNRWTVLLIMYGIPILSLLKGISREDILRPFDYIYRLSTGACGIRTFFGEARKALARGLKKWCKKLWGILKPHLIEYFILFVVMIYGMAYFSYGTFQDYSYGSGDIYVHHAWIQGLINGKIFSGGIYPEGMHCFVYCLHTLFGIRVYSILLFLNGIHISAFLISVYGLLREVFRSRYTPLFVLVLFLLLDLKSVNAVYAMSRLQFTIPQEFGLFSQFVCARYLVRYLKDGHDGKGCHSDAQGSGFKGKLMQYVMDENLFLFIIALAASIVTHYYVTIMAFLLCASFAVVFFRKVFSRKKFLPLVVSALCGLFIAAAPIAAARASGIPFEHSINWAMGVMNHTDPEKEEAFNIELYHEIEESSVFEKVFQMGYCEVYHSERAGHIVLFTGGAAFLWLLYRIGAWILKVIFSRRIDRNCFDSHLAIIIASILFMIVYASRAIGLPQIVAGSRLCAVEQMLILTVMVMPVDMLFSGLGLFCQTVVMQCLAFLGVASIYTAVLVAGVLHGSLYIELTRYNSSVMATQAIIKEIPKNSYTIVSTTDELYQITTDGYHEEWLTFLDNSKKEDYKLPTEYVFLFVEKRPLAYAQIHLFNGPAWLMSQNHIEIFAYIDKEKSCCPEIAASQISEEMSGRALKKEENEWDTYKILANRTIVESKAYEWCQRFSKLYPYEWNIAYEDENFVCYYFKQEPNCPYNLAFGQENGGR